MEEIEKAIVVGATKIGGDGKTRVYKEIKPGVFDWRKVKEEKKEESVTSSDIIDKVDIRKLAIEAIKENPEMEVDEYSQDGEESCSGACAMISDQIVSDLLKKKFKVEMIEVSNTKHKGTVGDDHTAVLLKDKDLIIDTQVWQFTNSKEGKPDVKMDKRKIIFTVKEYQKLGFVLKDMKKKDKIEKSLNPNVVMVKTLMDHINGKKPDQILMKALTEGQTKVKDGVTYVVKKTPSGALDWRKIKPDEKGSENKKDLSPADKIKKHLKNTDNEQLVKYASKKENDPTLRQLAYDELKDRGEDVSGINLNTGKTNEAKELFGTGTDGPAAEKPDELDLDNDSGITDWKDSDAIEKYFGIKGKGTKEQRIKVDNFIHNLKTKEKDYKPVDRQINSLNATYARFLKSGSPLMISSGGAGLGKTYNFKAVAKYMGLKEYDPSEETAEEGEESTVKYDYFEAPEIKTLPNLVQCLHEHNGKVIVFDDSDEVFKNPDNLGILKKATASSGKRVIGYKTKSEDSNIEPFEFTGQILIITNENQDYFTRNPHIDALYSRAIKNDIQATKKEKMEFIKRLKHTMSFTGLDRHGDKEADKKERDEVFSLIENNIDSIDPAKFSSRTFKEALDKKRAIDDANHLIDKDPVMGKVLFGDPGDWKKEVEDYLIKAADITVL